MILRLKPGTLQLPYTISRAGIPYVFAPDCEVPDDYGQALVKSKPGLFEEAKGEPDVTKYQFTDQFKNKSVADIVATLPDQAKLKVFEFAKAVASGKLPAPPHTGPDLTDLEKDVLTAFKAVSDDQKDNAIALVEALAQGRQIESLFEDESDLLATFRKLSKDDRTAVLKYVAKKE